VQYLNTIPTCPVGTVNPLSLVIRYGTRVYHVKTGIRNLQEKGWILAEINANEYLDRNDNVYFP